MGWRFCTRAVLILSKVLLLLLPRLRSIQRFLSSQLPCRCQDMTGCINGSLSLKNEMPAMLHCCSVRGAHSPQGKRIGRDVTQCISCLRPQPLCSPQAVMFSEVLKSHFQPLLPFVKLETGSGRLTVLSKCVFTRC